MRCRYRRRQRSTPCCGASNCAISVLQHIAQACNEALREGDLLGRIGGEEYLAALPRSTIEQAAEIAELRRRLVAEFAAEDLPAGLRITAVEAMPK
jgi:GGDEF domain-containing protein